MINTILLNNGVEMPQLGFGTIMQFGQQITDNVAFALQNGYQLIDTANRYGNEVEVGEGLKKSGLNRADYFLETKLGPTLYEKDSAVDDALARLGVEYIDLMILHHPVNNYIYAYKMLEKAYKEHKLRAIGISNFYVDRMVDFASFNRIKPMVNQVETHILNQQKTAKEWMDKYGVQIEAWAPFGEGRGGTFEHPVIADIAAKHGKTPAQVMLRWHIQRGVVAIPKSTHKERMEENFQVFDFALTDGEMQAISALDKGESAFFSHQDPAMVEWFVRMVEERKAQHGGAAEKKNW